MLVMLRAENRSSVAFHVGRVDFSCGAFTFDEDKDLQAVAEDGKIVLSPTLSTRLGDAEWETLAIQ